MKKSLVMFCAAGTLALVLTGCGPTTDTAGSTSAEDGTVPAEGTEDVTVPAEATEEKAESAFEDGVLTTSDVRFEITDHKVIPVGAKGNEYGEKPVLALWYTTTNVSGKDVDPLAFIFHFEAYQDNNPNAENKLNVGSLPDDRFLDSQTENIKKGGTVENAIAYELDDLTTPVKLVAKGNLFDEEELGSVTYNLKQ